MSHRKDAKPVDSDSDDGFEISDEPPNRTCMSIPLTLPIGRASNQTPDPPSNRSPHPCIPQPDPQHPSSRIPSTDSHLMRIVTSPELIPLPCRQPVTPLRNLGSFFIDGDDFEWMMDRIALEVLDKDNCLYTVPAAQARTIARLPSKPVSMPPPASTPTPTPVRLDNPARPFISKRDNFDSALARLQRLSAEWDTSPLLGGPKNPSEGVPSGIDPETTVVVWGFGDEFTRRDLVLFFSQYGDVERMEQVEPSSPPLLRLGRLTYVFFREPYSVCLLQNQAVGTEKTIKVWMLRKVFPEIARKFVTASRDYFHISRGSPGTYLDLQTLRRPDGRERADNSSSRWRGEDRRSRRLCSPMIPMISKEGPRYSRWSPVRERRSRSRSPRWKGRDAQHHPGRDSCESHSRSRSPTRRMRDEDRGNCDFRGSRSPSLKRRRRYTEAGELGTRERRSRSPSPRRSRSRRKIDFRDRDTRERRSRSRSAKRRREGDTKREGDERDRYVRDAWSRSPSPRYTMEEKNERDYHTRGGRSRSPSPRKRRRKEDGGNRNTRSERDRICRSRTRSESPESVKHSVTRPDDPPKVTSKPVIPPTAPRAFSILLKSGLEVSGAKDTCPDKKVEVVVRNLPYPLTGAGFLALCLQKGINLVGLVDVVYPYQKGPGMTVVTVEGDLTARVLFDRFDGTWLNGAQISVEVLQEKREGLEWEQPVSHGGTPPATTNGICIKNLPISHHLTSQSLKELFESRGFPVREARVPHKSSPFAFVKLAKGSQRAEAILLMDGMEMGGNRIKLQVARVKQ